MMLTTYFQASDFSINVDHILKNIAIFLIDDVDHMTWGLLENVSNPPSHDGLTHSSVRPTTCVGSVGFVPGDAWGFRGADEHLRPEVETLRLWVD